MLFVDNNEQIGLGVVLVVWRIGKKRRPSAHSCPVQNCYCFRVVVAEQSEDRDGLASNFILQCC